MFYLVIVRLCFRIPTVETYFVTFVHRRVPLDTYSESAGTQGTCAVNAPGNALEAQ